MSQSSTPRIAIAGGGPAALTLGALLHNGSIPFTIFELRPRPTSTDLELPSGMLDLHEESGLAAIRACGLYDAFLPLTGDCEESMIIADQDGTVLHRDVGGLEARPEIPRNGITRLMLSVVPEEAVQWDTKILGVHQQENGNVTLDLVNGCNGENRSETFDLVVGADGAWSRVRPFLSSEVPQDTGMRWTAFVIRDISTRFPNLAKMVGRGSYMALGGCHVCCSQRGAGDSAMVMLFVNMKRGAASAGLEALAQMKNGEITDVEALREVLLGDGGVYSGFGNNIKELIRVGLAEAETTIRTGQGNKPEMRSLAMLPVGHRWAHKARATLIGDAGHLMMPVGEGVNLAMWDALDLATALGQAWEAARKESGNVDRHVFHEVLAPLMKGFEDKMLTRAAEVSQESLDTAEVMWGEDAAKRMAEFMAQAYRIAEGQPRA